MRILMLGDYSNLHSCLARELRRSGHDVTLVSDRGGHMNTDADMTLRRKPGLTGSIGYLYRIMSALPSWTGYDVVQLINPQFFHLKPRRLMMVFDILRKNNRSVFLTLCGNDHFFVEDCVATDLFRFSEFRIGKQPTELVTTSPMREQGWLIPAHKTYTRHLYDNIDGAMSVLPEYDMSARRHLAPSKLIFTNLPVELSDMEYTPLPTSGPVRILIGMRGNMEIQKGTAKMLGICRQIEAELPGECEVRVVKDLSLADYLKELRESHLVIDQLYSYSPATNALQTMALGRITASGAQPEYYDYIGEDLRPIFCLSPLEDDLTIKERLKALIQDRGRMQQMSAEGRELVERHNDVKAIAPLFEAHWQKMMRQP